MKYFEKYTSNTLAGSGNQSFFVCEDAEKTTVSRTFYKVFAGGEYEYSFLFTNIMDSTFADGSHSRRNLIVDEWEMTSVRVGVVGVCSENGFEEPREMYTVTFDGKESKTVHPGEFFHTDGVMLSPEKGEYICIETAFKGKMIPYHEESIIPSFVLEDGKWVPCKKHPFASMVGCTRKAEKKIGFIGDSITQGIGTPVNSYTHWNAVVSEKLGERYAYHNLGLGYARADDAATDSAWLFKAKQNDIVVVCFGVNDIQKGYTEEEIKRNLSVISESLGSSGCKVVLQTIPPFDYKGGSIEKWKNVNSYIMEELSKKVAAVFDCVPILGKGGEEAHIALYGGHPDSEGCKKWGEALARKLAESGILN